MVGLLQIVVPQYCGQTQLLGDHLPGLPGLESEHHHAGRVRHLHADSRGQVLRGGTGGHHVGLAQLNGCAQRPASRREQHRLPER